MTLTAAERIERTIISDIDPASMSPKQLLDYCYDLEARLEVEGMVATNQELARLRLAFKLTVKEAEMLLLIVDGRTHSEEHLLCALYRSSDAPKIKIIKVLICKVRAKLKPHGFKIETIWGTGYRLLNAVAVKKIAAGEAPA